MVTVHETHVRDRDDGYMESEAKVSVQDGDWITAADLDLSTIDHAVVYGLGSDHADSAGRFVATLGSIVNPGTADNSMQVGAASLASGTSGALQAISNGSAIVAVRARGPET